MQILKIKTKNRHLGDIGEDAAAKFLKKQGYKILERNYEANGHEIDIIAANREYIVFVEVKTRTLGHTDPREPRPASAVTPSKQRALISAAKFYIAFEKSGRKKRFDVIEVFAKDENGKNTVAEIKHLINAFNFNTAVYK